MDGVSNLVILTTIYNDWKNLPYFVTEIDSVLQSLDISIELLIVDDGSLDVNDGDYDMLRELGSIRKITILHLTRNLGHQKAIAIGLAAVYSYGVKHPLVVMDSDGEDRPRDLPQLLEEFSKTPEIILFAKRSRRSENLGFRIFYGIYKILFRLLTGQSISFGNYSIVPPDILSRLVYLHEIWNHYAAGILRSGLPWRTISTPRGERYRGESKMDFTGLIVHGFSAISVFVEILTVRLLFLSLFIILLDLLAFGILFYVRLFTTLAIPGWATNVAIGLVILLFQAILFLTLLTFLVLTNRSDKHFIPAIDFKTYIRREDRVL